MTASIRCFSHSLESYINIDHFSKSIDTLYMPESAKASRVSRKLQWRNGPQFTLHAETSRVQSNGFYMENKTHWACRDKPNRTDHSLSLYYSTWNSFY